MNLIGLDLSIAGTGVCLPDGRAYTLKLAPALGDHRLGIIRRHIGAHLEGVDFAVIEDLPRNAMNASSSAMVQGVVRDVLNDHEIPYVKIVPSTLKLFATGHGKADKKAMVAAMRTAVGIKPDTHNAADAFWLWAAGMDWTGSPVCVIPSTRRRRLEVVDWTPVQDVIDAAIMRQAATSS